MLGYGWVRAATVVSELLWLDVCATHRKFGRVPVMERPSRTPSWVELLSAFRSKRHDGNAYLAFKLTCLAIVGRTFGVVLETRAPVELKPTGR